MSEQHVLASKDHFEVMEKPFPQLFGKYLLLEPIIDGGMATISLARHMRDIGDMSSSADKLLAIKTIKQEYSSDEKFRQMFMDEIKILFGLNHPNIVQSYDYGIQDAQLFISMEFIEGQNLRQFERKLGEKRKWFSIESSLYIVSEICHALHYAHNYKSKLSGQDYRIVHRDVSPDNLMITYDGQVKIIDFGIAKATVKEEHTQTGLLKGKSSYMAPEYLRDQSDLSPLSDQFSTGLVLWELLCGRKCFNEKKEVDNLTKIVECQIPWPQVHNPKVSHSLAKIVMKSLSKNPQDRFSSMDKFGKALTEVLNREYSGFYPTKLKKYAEVLFAEEIQELNQRLRNFGNIDIEPYKKKLQESHNLYLENGIAEADNNDSESSEYDFQLIHGQEDFDDNDDDELKTQQTSLNTDESPLSFDSPVEDQLQRSKLKPKDFIYEDEQKDSGYWASRLFRTFTYIGLGLFILSLATLADWYYRGSTSFVEQMARNWEKGDAFFKDIGGGNSDLRKNQKKKFQESVKEREKKIEKLKI